MQTRFPLIVRQVYVGAQKHDKDQGFLHVRRSLGGMRTYLVSVGGVKNIVKNKVFGLVGALCVVKRRLADYVGCIGGSGRIQNRF